MKFLKVTVYDKNLWIEIHRTSIKSFNDNWEKGSLVQIYAYHKVFSSYLSYKIAFKSNFKTKN